MIREAFISELVEKIYIHKPLKLHEENSAEAGFGDKKVTADRALFEENHCTCTAEAPQDGELAIQDGVITIKAPLRNDHWPEGAPEDGDYSNFGTAAVKLSIPKENWEDYNRIRFRVLPEIYGARVLHLNVSVANEGRIKLPDRYFREGATVFDLKNGEWNDCIWEFAAMPRDVITELKFYVFLSGHDIGAGPDLKYSFQDIRLEHVEKPEHERGWERTDETIVYSTAGYFADGKKTAITSATAGMFELVRAGDHTSVFSGEIRTIENENGKFGILDFSRFHENGYFCLKTDAFCTDAFEISDSVQEETIWKVLNFIFCERCGTPVPGKHGTCHEDILARHKGAALSFSGGWHDAGDVSQQALQSAETVHALLENAQMCRRRAQEYTEEHPQKKLYSILASRLIEEAEWGLDFILKTRFGDGYRATSAGATRFTDNLIGNFDDVEARVHNHAFDNFVFAGVEAWAGEMLLTEDPQLARIAVRAAAEDFAFAEEVFRETGVDPAHMFEHTWNSGKSQYYAAALYTAAKLAELTAKKDYPKHMVSVGQSKGLSIDFSEKLRDKSFYQERAEYYTDALLLCQEQDGKDIGIRGFFYRDESRRTIVHFNHQSREHQFMQALAEVCRAFPDSPLQEKAENGIRLYGEYLKAIAGNTAPYGMLPAGIHKMDEPFDAETFPYLHVCCRYEDEKDNYIEQLRNGREIAPGYVIKNFPVWFSFRGNSAVLLSMGKAAAIAGNYLKDPKLLEIGREQLYWMWGKNPFAQSLVYGAGSNYCRQYAVLCGEITGEVPVGIETDGNEDLPYWPQNNNATFREVWIGAACRMLWLCAEY